MSETINELYLNYVNSVGASLEDDRYFQYLFEIVQAGDNILQQNRQVLHKVVDETWLTIIEDTLDSINSIIEKPRRFVARKEEVVPVALARKITADSVRHLSMNTQFIAAADGDQVQPTKILNVSNEDSYDLYENRFIYHLIQKLVTFIDKRTDVIFWATKDEVRNTMTLESKIDDAYEEIEYKIELKVKNHQDLIENDADNMDVFMRIDRVRRLTMALRTSSFCELMAGCAKVRSPIQRTNLLMKDPDYRKCYNLWQFLERYDGVGYSIEERNTAMEFDEEYLLQMYVNLIANYTVFKSLSEQEPRDLDEASTVFHQVLQPKFVKEIHEEIVDDYNIPDVEIRQVIIEEVTQAQLDAEARAAEETARREAAEKAQAEAEAAAEEAFAQSQQAMQMMMDAQDRAMIAESMQASAEAVAEEAENARVAAEEARAAAEAQAEEARLASEQAQQARKEAEEARAQMAQLLSEAQAAMAAAQAAQAAAEKQAAEDRAARDLAVAASAAAEEAKLAADQARAQAETTCAAAIQSRDAAQAQANADRAAAQQAQLARQEAESARIAAEEASSAAQSAMEEAKAAQAAAVAQAEEYRLADQQSRQAYLNTELVRAALAKELEESQDTNTRSAAIIKRLEDQLQESVTLRAHAVDKMQRSVAARREAERSRAATEKELASVTRALTDAERERDTALEGRKQAEAAIPAVKEAAAQEADLRIQQLIAQSGAREQELLSSLSRTQKKLERAQRRLEERSLFNRLSKAISGSDAPEESKEEDESLTEI